jgi:hypothetical protein
MKEAGMKDRQGPGGRVPPVQRQDATDYRTLPWPTRLRLMIEELWDELSQADPQHDAARHALASLHQQARKEEERNLAKAGTPRHYFIIRPVNPLNPPATQDMTRIRDAITTLAGLGMICGPEGDTDEDQNPPPTSTATPDQPGTQT